MDNSIQSPRHHQLASLLREFRENANLSQSELASKLQEPQSFVSKYESGLRRLDLIELEQVSHAIGMKLVEVVNIFEEREPSES